MAKATKRLVICLNNTGYEASEALPAPVIDESGEDRLYDKTAFREVSLPQSLCRAVLLAA